jgi:hypothetical protein
MIILLVVRDTQVVLSVESPGQMRLGHSMPLDPGWNQRRNVLSAGYLLGTQITHEEFMKKFHRLQISFDLWEGPRTSEKNARILGQQLPNFTVVDSQPNRALYRGGWPEWVNGARRCDAPHSCILRQLSGIV